MTLVDTSVWVNHLRRGEPRLRALLEAGAVLTHAAVIGELACGNLTRRSEVLSSLSALPRATHASDDEALAVIERHRLHGRGIGWVDAHLLAAALLTKCALWTQDAALEAAARAAGVSP
ncbi:MAG: type II toxin-antitoxin system VapC family toxin [Anaeromyxobacteraceae bacterium]